MEFVCSHCEKLIQCSPVIVDQKHFVHTQCEKDFKEAKENKSTLLNFDSERHVKQIMKERWGKSGLLEGLKGLPKKNIAMLLECCKSSKIE